MLVLISNQIKRQNKTNWNLSFGMHFSKLPKTHTDERIDFFLLVKVLAPFLPQLYVINKHSKDKIGRKDANTLTNRKKTICSSVFVNVAHKLKKKNHNVLLVLCYIRFFKRYYTFKWIDIIFLFTSWFLFTFHFINDISIKNYWNVLFSISMHLAIKMEYLTLFKIQGF